MSDSPRSSPRSAYEALREERGRTLADCQSWDARLGTARGIVFLAGLVCAWGVWGGWQWPVAVLAAPAAVFLGLVVAHARVSDRLDRARRAVAYFRAGLDRLEGRWSGTGPTGQRYLTPEHLYASDMDVFGTGSLFQLLCRARTRVGEDVLAAWLAGPATRDVVTVRQQAVDELRDRVELREELALLEAAVHDALDQNMLRRWADEPLDRFPPPVLFLAAVLGLGGAVGLVAWLGFGAGLSWILAPLLCETILAFAWRKPLHRVLTRLERGDAGLAILAQVLAVLERQEFRSPALQALRARLDADGRPPSRRIARLHDLLAWFEHAVKNQFVAPVAFVLCAHLPLANAVESWRRRFGPAVSTWLDVVGEFEALCSLAGHAFEHPQDPFPEIVDGPPCFVATGLGHPLLPPESCVRNDVSFGTAPALLLVSGSNMSGKSTLLRTIGTNTVLALAGGPVRATRLVLSPFAVASAMRISDSLQEGHSLFHAVVLRIRQVVERARGAGTVLFLLDEILQGTNSHDRRVGAEGVIRSLLDRGAVGLVTTHDLALTEMVPSLGERAVNVHFEDHIQDGRMTFDYHLRPGVVQRSNALALMRMMGLDV